jgi:hypothetical protein
VNVVVRGEEVTELHGTPAALQADVRFAIAQATADARVRGHVGLDLEDRVQAATERLGATHAEARRVRVHAVDPRLRDAFRLAADLHRFHRHVDATVQRDVRGLRLRGQRGGQHTRDGESDKLLIHEVSPYRKKWPGSCSFPAEPLGVEKLRPLKPTLTAR